MSKKDKVKRSIFVECSDEEDSFILELSKVTAVKTKQKMIHLDELPDGSWRLIYNSDHIPDFTKIQSLKIVREGENE